MNSIKKILIFIPIIFLILLMMTNCTPTVDNDTYDFEFADSTRYLLSANAGNDVVITDVDYRCKIEKNGSDFVDSTYRNLSVFVKLIEDGYWRHIETFGAYDSVFYVSYRSHDSIRINIDNNIQTIEFINFNVQLDTFNVNSDSTLIPLLSFEDEFAITLIDSVNNYYNGHTPYPDWKSDILEMYY